MKQYVLPLAMLCGLVLSANAQRSGGAAEPSTVKNDQPISKSRVLKVDSAMVTKHTVTIKGALTKALQVLRDFCLT